MFLVGYPRLVVSDLNLLYKHKLIPFLTKVLKLRLSWYVLAENTQA